MNVKLTKSQTKNLEALRAVGTVIYTQSESGSFKANHKGFNSTALGGLADKGVIELRQSKGLLIFSIKAERVMLTDRVNGRTAELIEDKGRALVVRYTGETRTHRILATRFNR